MCCISIIFNINFSYISTLNGHNKLIERLIVYELDIRSKFQGYDCSCSFSLYVRFLFPPHETSMPSSTS